jgi:chitodextrinase
MGRSFWWAVVMAGCGGAATNSMDVTGSTSSVDSNSVPTAPTTGEMTGATALPATQGPEGGSTGAGQTTSTTSTASTASTTSTEPTTAPGDTTSGSVTGSDSTSAETAAAQAPFAEFAAVPAQGPAPLLVKFDATGSTDPDGAIVAYAWDFGDGTLADGPLVEHIFAQPGTYTVELVVTDDDDLVAETSAQISAQGCPTYAPVMKAGALTLPVIDELSGLVASRSSPGVLWVHDDDPDPGGGNIHAFSSTASHLATYKLVGINFSDLEDVAIGPGPLAGTDYLYLGEIGDNNLVKKSIKVFRVAEPVVDPMQAPVTADLAGIETFTFTYPGGVSHNAETLLVDPVDGAVFVVSKAGDQAEVFRAEALEVGQPSTELALVATVAFKTATAGDVTSDGAFVALRSYGGAQLWPRPPGQPLEAAFMQPSCKLPNADSGEALGFAPAALDFYTTKEGVSPPLHVFVTQ